METVKIVRFKPDLCTGCLKCEQACSKVHFKTDDGGEYSAIRIIKTQNGFQMTDCNHCGLCIDLCPTLALKRSAKGTVLLDKKLCVGCQSCVAFCPNHVMRKAPGVLTPFKCISCGACVRACPENALELVEMKIDEVAEVVYHQEGVCS
jgi:carbon-monoxide dehydrogenase iron sulfur subunit